MRIPSTSASHIRSFLKGFLRSAVPFNILELYRRLYQPTTGILFTIPDVVREVIRRQADTDSKRQARASLEMLL